MGTAEYTTKLILNGAISKLLFVAGWLNFGKIVANVQVVRQSHGHHLTKPISNHQN